MPLKTAKDIKRFYSIKEVADMFGVTETLLRYWESCFPTIKPRKSGRNVRQYTQDDIKEVRLVYNLVKVRGMKLAAARETINKTRESAEGTADMLEHLQHIREELLAIKRELDGIV